MNRLSRVAIALTTLAALAACQPKPGAPEPASAQEAAHHTAPGETTSVPLVACTLEMTLPEAHEWTTYWDPVHDRASQHPSGVSSVHWGDANEKTLAHDTGMETPFDLVCGNDEGVKPTVSVGIAAFDSGPEDIPLATGTYVIAPKASPADNKPGEFIVTRLLFNDSVFEAHSGTLSIDRFDMKGVSGSFVIHGKEVLTGSRPLHLKGTFDMPCRGGQLQSACASRRPGEP
jgi:hypothetical protein